MRRLQRVVRAVATDGPVERAQVAFEHGYYDQSHLVQDFGELAGITPKAYRPRTATEWNHVAVEQPPADGFLHYALADRSYDCRMTLQARLVVDGAARAIEFYASVFGAQQLERHEDPAGKVVHAALACGESRFSVKDADDTDPAPTALGGTSVLLSLAVDDVDALGERMVEAGGEVVFPIQDWDHGRGGRIRDPFGHAWMLSQR